MQNNDFQELQDKVGKWADSKLKGETSLEGMIRHLKEEVDHLLKNPYDPESYADVQILFMNIARVAGFTMDDLYLATEAKHTINLAREWAEPDEQGIVRHIK
jgi:hypothetical protein